MNKNTGIKKNVLLLNLCYTVHFIFQKLNDIVNFSYHGTPKPVRAQRLETAVRGKLIHGKVSEKTAAPSRRNSRYSASPSLIIL